MKYIIIYPCFPEKNAVLVFYISLVRELDVDKPRNLAKSVTVEHDKRMNK